jgi:hypothetical protein
MANIVYLVLRFVRQRTERNDTGAEHGTSNDWRPKRIHRFRVASGKTRRKKMSLGTVLLIVLILVLAGVIPSWPHSKNWGYAPGSVVGLLLVVVLVMLVTGGL